MGVLKSFIIYFKETNPDLETECISTSAFKWQRLIYVTQLKYLRTPVTNVITFWTNLRAYVTLGIPARTQFRILRILSLLL
jgi:hypothetical protein